jgi:ribosomal protein S12 methylthiotransferase
VGFPTETDEEFDELVHDLTALNLDHVGVFSFSKEEGTKAAEMDGQLHPGVKRKRKKKLISVLQEQRTDKLTALIGSRVTVMVEGPAPESELLIQARMASQAQEIDGRVIINDLGALYDQAIGAGESVLQPGDFVTVEITELAQQDLVAKLISIDLPMKKPTTEGTAPGLNTIQKGIEHRHDERTAQ